MAWSTIVQFAVARLREFVPFMIAGLIATGVNYGTLYVLLGLIGIATMIAVTAAFMLSSSTNFFLQKFWAFGERSLHRLPSQLFLFAAASLLGLGVNDAVFWLFNDVTHVGYLFAEIPATAAVSVVGFLASIYIFRFKEVRKATEAVRR
ncbi:MAG: GtrA family protein [Xanthobacteraceae bacterium]